MQKRTPLPKGTVLESRYRISRRLASGGMGAVYEAEDIRLKNRVVALKETFADTAETRKAFEREAGLLANTAHDAFPFVIDYFTEGDGCFLVMELIRGEDLYGMLSARTEPFEEAQVLDWADQILDALDYLHSKKIVHRDIKPANLKLTPNGRIKLLDFGIAKGNLGELNVTTVGSLAATLQYAPLEQVLRADANYHAVLSVNFAEKVEEILRAGTDARTDLYALGATLYQLLTKRLPKNSPTRATAVWSGQADTLQPVHHLNPLVSVPVSEALDKMLALEKEKRPVSALDMKNLLQEAKSGFEENEASPIFTLFEENTFISNRENILDDTNSEKGKIKINFAGPHFTVFSPKFETISESRQIPVFVFSLALIAIIGLSFWGWRFRTVSSAEAAKPTVERNQPDRDRETKPASQTKQFPGTKTTGRTKTQFQNKTETPADQTEDSAENVIDASRIRPRRMIEAKSLEDVIIEKQKAKPEIK